MLTTLNTEIQSTKLGDSIIIQVKAKDRQEPQLVLHTSDLRKNFDCWYKVMLQPEGTTEACFKY